MADLLITIKGHNESIRSAEQDKRQYLRALADYLKGMAGGVHRWSGVDRRASVVAATGTLTLATVLATHTCSINGVTFTAVTGAAGANQFSIDGNDAADAAALAAAINASASALVSGHVTATANGAVVTLTAKTPGVSGNAIAIASGQATIVASGARLTGGTETLTAFVP